MRLPYLLLAAVLFALMPGRAAAGYAFQFADSGGNYTNNFSTTVGQTVAVEVFLVQSGGSTGLTSTGLTAGGVSLSFNQAIANVPNTGAITPNPAFDNSTTSVGTGIAKLNVNSDVGPVFAPTTGPNAGAILLGTFTFTGVSGGTTSVTTGLPQAPPFQNNVLGDGTLLDGIIANSSAVITVAVPEPGTLVLTSVLAFGGLAGAVWRRYRRREAVA
jgi:hypothetical protein